MTEIEQASHRVAKADPGRRRLVAGAALLPRRAGESRASRSSRPSTASKRWRRCWRSRSISSSSMSTCRGWTAFPFFVRFGAALRDVATLPALVITTEAGEQDVDAARAAGANFYLVKPVSQPTCCAMPPCSRERRHERPA